MLEQSQILMEFNIGSYNGTMRLEIFVNDNLIEVHDQFLSDRFTTNLQISWPSTLRLVLSNKNKMDTQVDNTGKITADKFVQLKRILVDRIEPANDFYQSLVLHTKRQQIRSNYWGFNGWVELNFDQNNSFVWHLQQLRPQQKTYITDQKRA